jgi:hypothetical protein
LFLIFATSLETLFMGFTIWSPLKAAFVSLITYFSADVGWRARVKVVMEEIEKENL